MAQSTLKSIAKLVKFRLSASVAGSAVFGYLIAIVGTYQGFAVTGGAEGVGRGTNMAVVWGMILVLVVDFFLTAILIKVL